MKRGKTVAGNWKMHKTVAETRTFMDALAPMIEGKKTRVMVAPPFTALEAAAASGVMVGGQNMCEHATGPYTGEISSEMLREVGAKFVIIGHSERRHCFHEKDVSLRAKVKMALATDLIPIFCIGETDEQRERGDTKGVLTHQLEEGLKGIGKDEVGPLILAYEPVWAIGTGKTATPELAEEVHAFSRRWIEGRFGLEIAENLYILYGGSVKPANTKALLGQPNIDGALVGGASLDVGLFGEIITHAEELIS